MPPLISICVPAYKNVSFLQRLLQSISVQTFTDFEVIITDDSNDNSVSDCIKDRVWHFPLAYFKNEKALGSPENWNAAVSYATGKWIKMMHHDDWFSSENSLQVFATAAERQPAYNFFYSSYQNVYENGSGNTITPPARFLRQIILKNPTALLGGNIIGPPSATLYINDTAIQYDKQLRWLVDLDFYMQYLKNTFPYFIADSLVNIGIHHTQITKESFGRPEIEIPEHLVVLEKAGERSLKNPIVYDAFWRLLRNLRINSLDYLQQHNMLSMPVPAKLLIMIRHQKLVPHSLLKIGAVSKIAMMTSWLLNRG